MTVGEKIQLYRKKNNLSQEELGRQLLVSRQTVSLWEMDKTMPTVDNLLLLKEIFGVSLDDLLSRDEPVEETRETETVKETEAASPSESYVFQYGATDLREVGKATRRPLAVSMVIFAVACAVLFVVLAAADAGDPLLGMTLGWFTLGLLVHIKGLAAHRKAWKSTEARVKETTYSHDVYDGWFLLTLSRGGETVRTQKIRFGEIEHIAALKHHIILTIAGQYFILKKDALSPDSVFTALAKRVPEKTARPARQKPTGILKTVSVLLCVLSLCTIMGALMTVALLTETHRTMEESMWAFFLFLPIPVASVAFGFWLKKKNYRYKMNVIAGFIMAGVLCLYGSFSFMLAGVYDHSDEPIRKAEAMLEIDFPSHTRINTQDWTQSTQNIPRGYMISSSDVYFDGTAAEVFEQEIAGDARWMTAVPGELVGITSYLYDLYGGDYCMVYNVDTGELNKLPSESGTYVFINVLYNAESNSMMLVEYEIEYTK